MDVSGTHHHLKHARSTQANGAGQQLHDTGVILPNHFHPRAGLQSHFVQSLHVVRRAEQLIDVSFLTRLEHLQRDDIDHGESLQRREGKARKRSSQMPIETEFQRGLVS